MMSQATGQTTRTRRSPRRGLLWPARRCVRCRPRRPRDAARGLTLARADQAAAEEQAALRTRAFQRQKDLSARGVGTEAATEAAELAASSSRQAALSRSQAVAQAEARVDQAATRLSRVKIALAESERRLADTTVTAPFAGTLSGVTLVEGRLVTQNERLAALVDGTQLEAAVRLSTAQYVRLLDDEGRLVARPAKITLDLWGTALTTTGMLTRASAETGDGQTGRLVFAQIDAARGLKPGDFVTVSVEEPAIEQVVRLIRSKGVGVYFVTQNPLDVPESVLGQLGNRVQHALRAFTPRDQKAVKAAAETMRIHYVAAIPANASTAKRAIAGRNRRAPPPRRSPPRLRSRVCREARL